MILTWVAAITLGLISGPAIAAAPQIFQAQTEGISLAVGVHAERSIPPQTDLRTTRDDAQDDRGLQLAAKRRRSRAGTKSPEENKKAGEAFLAENRTKEGVVTLPSGLQYTILKAGDGKIPVDGDMVDCFIRATLIDNTLIGGSPRGKPSTFKVGESIPGLTEALKLMPVGSKWRLFIPSELAYGEKGTPGRIGPNTTLIYEVELLAIKAPAPPPRKKSTGALL